MTEDEKAKALRDLTQSLDDWEESTDEAVNLATAASKAGFMTEGQRDDVYAAADLARRAISQGREAITKKKT
jgi:hypothetical protein